MNKCFICRKCQRWQFVKELTNWRRVSNRGKNYIYISKMYQDGLCSLNPELEKEHRPEWLELK